MLAEAVSGGVSEPGGFEQGRAYTSMEINCKRCFTARQVVGLIFESRQQLVNKQCVGIVGRVSHHPKASGVDDI